MDSASAVTGEFKCAICLNDAFDHSAEGAGRYQGRTVRLDCSCKSHYHLSCLKTHWNTSVALTSGLEVDNQSREYWRICIDMLVAGVDPDTFEFEDVPIRKDKRCPICKSEVLELSYVAKAAPQSANPSEVAAEDSPGRVYVEATETADKIVAPVRKGKSFGVHNIRAFVSHLREKSLISPELVVDEKKLVAFIHNQLAEMDMAGQDAQKRVVAYLQAPVTDRPAAAASSSGAFTLYQPVVPCCQLTPADIRSWVDVMKSIGRIDNNMDVEIDLLTSFIMYELGGEDFNSGPVRNRIIEFINSQKGC